MEDGIDSGQDATDGKVQYNQQNVSSLLLGVQDRSPDNILGVLLFLLEESIISNGDRLANPANEVGLTRFHIFCKVGKCDLVNYFIDKGVDINQQVDKNARDFGGYTPLHFAIKFTQFDIVKILLDHGADITIQDNQQMTALHLADFCDQQLLLFSPSGARPMGLDLLLPRYEGISENFVNCFGLSHFHIACKHNKLTIVKCMLNAKIDINHSVNQTSPYRRGYTGLHFAVEKKNLELVEFLLISGADINRRNNRGDTALHTAVGNHCIAVENNNLELVEFLLISGADINHQNDCGDTALHMAFQRGNGDIIDILLKSLRYPICNLSTKNNLSYFHIACTRNNLAIVTNWLENGVSVDASVTCDSSEWGGFTALHFAIAFGRLDNVKKLLSYGADPRSRNNRGLTPLHVACEPTYYFTQGNCHEICRKHNQDFQLGLIKLLPHKDTILEIFQLVLSAYIARGDLDILNEKDPEWGPLIFYAYERSTDPLSKVIGTWHGIRWEIIQTLVRSGADVRSTDNVGETLLHSAASFNKLENEDEFSILDLYLKNGADINAREARGFIPLHLAIQSENVKMVRYLVEHGANVEAQDPSWDTPLHAAVRLGVRNVEILRYLVDGGANVEARDRYGDTPLHIATKRSYQVSVEFLIEKRANIYSRDGNGMNLLDIIVDGNWSRTSPEPVEYAVGLGLDVNAQDDNGNTPLHTACRKRNKQATKTLLDLGADITIRNNESKRPLEIWAPLYEGPEWFVSYTEKLKMIGIEFDSNILSPCKPWVRELLIEAWKETDFYEKISIEIEKMKATPISNYSTLFDIFFVSENKMLSWIQNSKFEDIVTSKDYEINFPNFGKMIKSK